MKKLVKKSTLMRFLSLVMALAFSLSILGISTVAIGTDIANAQSGGLLSVYFAPATQAMADNAVTYSVSNPINAISTGKDSDGGCRYGYSRLAAAEKLAYDSLVNAINAFIASEDYSSKDFTPMDSFTAEIGITDATQGAIIFRSVIMDNPQYYWLSGSVRYRTSGSTSTYYLAPESYYYTAASRTSTDEAISETTKTWLKECRDGGKTDDYDIAVFFHDKIISAIDYSYTYGSPTTAIWAHNIDGVLTGKGSVCEGYAKAYSYLLNLSDVDNIYIIGSASSAHAWNYVKVDGAYYCVDVTWDDLNGENAIAEGFYDYAFTPYSTFSSSHTPYSSTGNALTGEWLYPLDTASNSTSLIPYYQMNSYADATITSANVSAFISGITPWNKIAFYTASNSTVINTILTYLNQTVGLSEPALIYSSVYGKLAIQPAPSIISSVKTPATGLSLSKSALSIKKGESTSLSVTVTPSGSDDSIIWSTDDSSVVSVDGSGKLVAKRAGTAEITAKALVGKVKATCTVTVAPAEGEVSPGGCSIWVGGKDNKTTSTYYKTCTIEHEAKYSGGIWTAVVTPATEEYDTPAEIVALFNDKGKPVLPADVAAAMKKTATAKINKGIITVRAGSLASNIRVWIVEVKDKAPVFDETRGIAPISYDISVLMGSCAMAAGSVYYDGDNGSITKAPSEKKAGVALNSTATFYINPAGTKTENEKLFYTPSDYETYTVELKKSADAAYVDLSYSGGRSFKVTGTGLNSGKPVTVSILITSLQTGKRVTFPVTIHNPVTVFGNVAEIELSSGEARPVLLSAFCADGGISVTTDRLSAFASNTSSASDAMTRSKGKVAYNGAAKSDKVTLSLSNTTLTVKAGKNSSGTTSYVYVCAVNSYGMPVYTSFKVTVK